MFRFAIALSLLATPLAAQDKAADCAMTGDVVNAIVAARVGGMSERKARKTVTNALTDDTARFKPAVEPLAQWIYTLPQDQLNDEVGAAYVTACIAQ